MNKQNQVTFSRRVYNWLLKIESYLSQAFVSIIVFIYTYAFCNAVLFTDVSFLTVLQYLLPVVIVFTVLGLYALIWNITRIKKSQSRISEIMSSNQSPREKAVGLFKEFDYVSDYIFSFFGRLLWRRWFKSLERVIDSHLKTNNLSFKDFTYPKDFTKEKKK